ncbi:hypothetical protein RUM44_008995 [Polyplax serrata]|uniref:Carboxypeptidase n=1 Tax=Polyplax serrata TaxID=468196 RepID=A0ABR1AT55_POLSC
MLISLSSKSTSISSMSATGLDSLRTVLNGTTMVLYFCAVTVLLTCTTVRGFANPYPRAGNILGTGNTDLPVIITPYIEEGKIGEIRNLTRVEGFLNNVESYAGFATVNKKCNSNMYFWFFPAPKTSIKEVPVSVWLQGGPGATSLYGLFMENGPFQLSPTYKLGARKYAWTSISSFLYIDNPVGTGYSFTDGCYSKTEEEVGHNLLVAVKQILKMFPEIRKNPFYVTGESYAGKYVPALAYAIHKDSSPEEEKINLRGIAIGNGLVDPLNQLHYSDYLYQLGMLDDSERAIFKAKEEECHNLIIEKNWREAFHCFDELLNGDQSQYPTYFYNVTGFTNYFNYLHSKAVPEADLSKFITKDEVRTKIHVGNATWHDGNEVELNLIEDVMQSTRHWVEELLEHYKVLIYNGQLDIIVAYPLTESYLKELKWSAAGEYKTAKRYVWKVDNTVAGYVKTAGNLIEILLRDAGHMVPKDQPKWALDMLSRFFNGKPFHRQKNSTDKNLSE